MSTRRSGWICPLCFSLVSGFAQLGGPVRRAESPASVSPGGENRRITLDVVVTGKSGQPRAGLEQRDFTLLDNHQPRQIVSFQAIGGGTATADAPVEVILVIDEINASFVIVASQREEIEKFLRRDGGELRQPVSVVFLSESGPAATESSRDGNAVIAEMKQRQSGLRTLGKAQGGYGGGERALLSVDSIQRFAAYEAAIPGRKLVVWISPGWPFGGSGPNRVDQRQQLFDSIVNLSDALERARITLYHVDPLGAAEAGESRTWFYEHFPPPVKTAAQADYGALALHVLAHQSGGRVLYAGNDVAGEIAACVADANAFYVLSFDGVAGETPNQYHALEIRLGKPGLTARTRSGYYAQPEIAQ
jgi:VWFA-related protein